MKDNVEKQSTERNKNYQMNSLIKMPKIKKEKFS